MRLERLELAGFKSFAKKTTFLFSSPVVAIVGPNGSGKSNVADACRFVLGEQSLKSLRGKRGEDFIWHGSQDVPRASRAAITVAFDNRDGGFPLDAAEVEVSREVHRDGTNDYLINRSSVRLKDLTESLHRAALGSSGYHIISQGEADKILISPPAERRQIVETALGLRFYEWQLAEAEKKLTKTKENLVQAELLRREVAPQLKFLKKEMGKIEHARELRRELKNLATSYFADERSYLNGEVERFAANERVSREKLKESTARLTEIEKHGTREGEAIAVWREKLLTVEKQVRDIVLEREDLTRRLGRLEGLMEAKANAPNIDHVAASAEQVENWTERMEVVIGQMVNLDDLNLLRVAWTKIKQIVTEMRQWAGRSGLESKTARAEDLKPEYDRLTTMLGEVANRLVAAEVAVKETRQALEHEAATRSEAERALVELKFAVAAENSKLETLIAEITRLKNLQTELEHELAEVIALTDREFLETIKNASVMALTSLSDRNLQITRHRQIDRFKIQLEETGVGSGEIASEYDQVAARDAHLAREIADLSTSIKSLEQVAKDLKQKINQEFEDGLQKINLEFQNFFTLLFDGGKAKLLLIKPPKMSIETEEEGVGEMETSLTDGGASPGLEIEINLPRKRVRNLEMLSGGERSLTSIALLFALSRVHPPPFMILDETDAALDESNSKKYADMVETLAKDTQLILITHNRETMSRAGTIYGVTMGADGISRLLSIKFDEAVSYAKT